MLGETNMLYMYTGSLLYRWGWGIKSKMAKAPDEDISLQKNYSKLHYSKLFSKHSGNSMMDAAGQSGYTVNEYRTRE